MTSGLAFWGPFLAIFGAALIISVAQRYARDICLMRFNHDHVVLRMKDGKWIWGTLRVHSKALEITYCDPVLGPTGEEHLTHILYEQNLPDIVFIMRPEPARGTRAYDRWLREMERLRNPPIHRRVRRNTRNVFNMLRNAFSESISLLIGVVKQRTAVGRIPTVDTKATETGQKLLTAIPANYEPILERYRSGDVAVVSSRDIANPASGTLERVGIFEEYSEKFILLRDVRIAESLPEHSLREEDAPDRFAVIVPRTSSWVRHRVRRRTSHPAAVQAVPA